MYKDGSRRATVLGFFAPPEWCRNCSIRARSSRRSAFCPRPFADFFDGDGPERGQPGCCFRTSAAGPRSRNRSSEFVWRAYLASAIFSAK